MSRSHRLTFVFLVVILLAGAGCGRDDAAERRDVAGENSEDVSTQRIDEESDSDWRVSRVVDAGRGDDPDRSSDEPSTASATSDGAGDLLEELDSLDWDDLTVTDRPAVDALNQLRSQGNRAALPIRDFLLESQGSEGFSLALKQALLDILFDLRSPESEVAVLDLLANESDPVDVWQMGMYLEGLAPGGHSDAIRLAAQRALYESDPASVLPGAFFELVGRVGNADTSVVLSDVSPHNAAYASLALATINDDSGLALLEQRAREFEAGNDTIQGRLAIQLLAQQAPRSETAAAALIGLAENGAIPEDVWHYVLDIVAGTWEWSLTQPELGEIVGSHTFYSPQGNQVIFRVARPMGLDGDAFARERLDLLDVLQPLAPPGLVAVPGDG